MAVALKTVIVGNDGIGKTSMQMTYSERIFPEYIPTTLGLFTHDKLRGKTIYTLTLWDTVSPHEYDRLRPTVYPDCDVFLLMYSVVNQDSYDSILKRWIPEIKAVVPNPTIVLAGTQTDLRSGGAGSISTEEGQRLAEEIEAVDFTEFSSKTMLGIDALYEKLFDAAIASKDGEKANLKQKCIIQ